MFVRQREKSCNVSVIQEPDGKKIVLINDIRFKGKNREEWNEIEEYLKEYVGEYYEIEENSDIVYIDSDFPDEFANSESRLALKGPVAKAKVNASQGIPELIQIATGETYQENTKRKRVARLSKILYGENPLPTLSLSYINGFVKQIFLEHVNRLQIIDFCRRFCYT